uniref:INCENP_ARK-bind domain-containing protein n=1 Tax=Strongyloides stercoralis TaxID=6248 RepID=A0A0K0ED61_STRER
MSSLSTWYERYRAEQERKQRILDGLEDEEEYEEEEEDEEEDEEYEEEEEEEKEEEEKEEEKTEKDKIEKDKIEKEKLEKEKIEKEKIEKEKIEKEKLEKEKLEKEKAEKKRIEKEKLEKEKIEKEKLKKEEIEIEKIKNEKLKKEKVEKEELKKNEIEKEKSKKEKIEKDKVEEKKLDKEKTGKEKNSINKQNIKEKGTNNKELSNDTKKKEDEKSKEKEIKNEKSTSKSEVSKNVTKDEKEKTKISPKTESTKKKNDKIDIKKENDKGSISKDDDEDSKINEEKEDTSTNKEDILENENLEKEDDNKNENNEDNEDNKKDENNNNESENENCKKTYKTEIIKDTNIIQNMNFYKEHINLVQKELNDIPMPPKEKTLCEILKEEKISPTKRYARRVRENQIKLPIDVPFEQRPARESQVGMGAFGGRRNASLKIKHGDKELVQGLVHSETVIPLLSSTTSEMASQSGMKSFGFSRPIVDKVQDSHKYGSDNKLSMSNSIIPLFAKGNICDKRLSSPIGTNRSQITNVTCSTGNATTFDRKSNGFISKLFAPTSHKAGSCVIDKPRQIVSKIQGTNIPLVLPSRESESIVPMLFDATVQEKRSGSEFGSFRPLYTESEGGYGMTLDEEIRCKLVLPYQTRGLTGEQY